MSTHTSIRYMRDGLLNIVHSGGWWRASQDNARKAAELYCRGLDNYQYYFGVPYYMYSISRMDPKILSKP